MEGFSEDCARVVGIDDRLALSDVILKWTQRIAVVAGTTADRVKITIDHSGAAEFL
jgi:hypothetical protein